MLNGGFVPRKVKALAAHLGCEVELAHDLLQLVAQRAIASEGESYWFEMHIKPTLPAEAVTDSDDADEGLPTGPAFVKPTEVPRRQQRRPKPATPIGGGMPLTECGPWRLRRVVAETGKLVDADVRRLVEQYENAPENSDTPPVEAWDKLTAGGWSREA